MSGKLYLTSHKTKLFFCLNLSVQRLNAQHSSNNNSELKPYLITEIEFFF